MTKVERTKKAIFEKYPDAVIEWEYPWGEVLFYVNEAQKSTMKTKKNFIAANSNLASSLM